MPPTRFLNIDKLRARYVVYGDGARAIVLVPSMYLLARTYAPTASALVALDPTVRVITIELPGSGGSSSLPVRWTHEDYAYFLVHALEVLHIERPAALIGHSNSAAVVLTAAARHPRYVGPIVLA